MRIQLPAIALTIALASACSAAAADSQPTPGGDQKPAAVTGQWKSEFESPVGQLKYVYDLMADAGRIRGKAIREVDGQKTETEIKDGKLTGDEVAFVEILQRDGQEIRIEYKGKIKDDEIKFTRQVGDFATMEIVAKREPGRGARSAAAGITLKVIKVDSEEISGENGRGANAVDGNASTFWHTQWQDENPLPPHEIIIELSPPSRIKGLTCLPRQDESDHGAIKNYELYVSNDGKEFGQPIKKSFFNESKDKKTVTFDPTLCRFIKLRAISEINGEAWTSVAEIDVIAE